MKECVFDLLSGIDIKRANDTSTRVFTSGELSKLTKASYQFLTRMIFSKIIHATVIEQIIHQLLQSNSRFVTLQETKWTIRSKMASYLDAKELAFLDLVLYQKEDELPLH